MLAIFFNKILFEKKSLSVIFLEILLTKFLNKNRNYAKEIIKAINYWF